MGRKRKGAFTLYFGVIFMSVLLIGLSVLDFARMNVYKVQAQRAMEITANSLITKYDKSIQDNYGLFMSPSEKVAERAGFLMKENFQAGSLSGADKKFQAVRMNAAEVKEQILEYMKYRGPLIAVSKIYSMFSSLKSISSSGDKFSDRLDTELSNADFLEALNEYRYYLHGWTFEDRDPDEEGKNQYIDYKYIAQNPKDANGYFVRSFIDFAAENPYEPYIDMNNRSLFRDALTDFDVDGYAAHYESGHHWEGANRMEEITVLTQVSGDMHDHDWEMAAFLAVLEDKKAEGAEGLDEKIDALKEYGVHDAYPDLMQLAHFSMYDYQDYINDNKMFSLLKLLEYYVQYYEAQTEEEKEQETTPIDTDLIQSLRYIDVGLNEDARWLERGIRLTQKNYRILEGLKASNKEAQKKLKDVAKYLNDYEASVRHEQANLGGAREKDPNYVAKTEPMLEDKLEMIALMREKLQKVQAKADNKFDENIRLLDEMIKKLCVPEYPTYGSVEYYEITADNLETVMLKEMVKNHGKMKSTQPLLKQRVELIKKVGKNASNTFDKEGFLALQKKYLENCQNMHIDFNKEQLFNQVEGSGESTKKTSQGASGSFSKLMSIAKKIVDDIFSFGSGKELTEEEYHALPSYQYFHGTADEEPDTDVYGSDTGSSKGNKKAAESSKGWVNGIKNVFESFKRLAQDPLGMIYVNEYIMTAFRSSVTGKGDYKDQINLRFQDKKENPKADALKLESEIEYIISGESSDSANNKDIAGKILMLRVLPNLLFVLTNGETNGLASALASAISAAFPPIYPLVYIVICVLWALAESAVDIFVLRLGQKVAFLKCTGDFMLAPSGIAELVKIFAKATIDSAANAVKNGINEGLDAIDDYATQKVQDLEQHAKDYIKKQVDRIADKVGDKLKVDEIEEYVVGKYKTVESAISDLEKSIDNYVQAVVGKYLVEVEKFRQEGLDLGLIDKDGLVNTAITKRLEYAAQANLGDTIMSLLKQKLKEALSPTMPSAMEIAERIKQDGAIKPLLDAKKEELRKKMEEKLDEYVFDPINEELKEQKDKVKGEVSNYLNSKVDQGAQELQKYYDENIHSALSEAVGSGSVDTTEKANSGFKLGYEDYLRIYLIFTEEDAKMFRILDLVQLRENKQLNSYMAGVRLEVGFNVPYLFLPRLIQIAKKQSSAITVNESDYERVDFRLRAVAGY